MQKILNNLGWACAMNNYREGALTHLCLQGNFNHSGSFTKFLDNLWISDKDHEEVYGDKTIAADMKLDQLTKKIYCGLEYLSADFGDTSSCQNFNFKELEK